MFLELFSEDDVDENVDWGVESDQQVGGFCQRFQLDVQYFQDVDDQRKNVAENVNRFIKGKKRKKKRKKEWINELKN